MRRFSLQRLTFRTRTLLISSAVALIPFILFAIGVTTEVRTSLVEKAQSEHRAILTGIAQQIRGTLTGYENLVTLLARDKRIQSFEEDALHDALHNFHRFNNFFVSTFIYDDQTRIRFIEHRNHFKGEHGLVGRRAGTFSKRFETTVQKVITRGEAAYFDHIEENETESFLLFMAPIPPFSGDGPNIGVVSSAVQLYGHQFQELLDAIEVSPEGYCLILDRRNRVIARRGLGLPDTLRMLDINPLTGGVEMPHGSGSPSRSTADPASLTGQARILGRHDLVSVQRLPALGCSLVVGNPQEEVLRFLQFLTVRIFMFGLFALIIGVVCALYLSRSLLHPILRLTEGIQKVGEGATAHRLPVEGHDELAQASTAFNRMAAYLQKSKLMERIWMDKWTGDAPD